MSTALLRCLFRNLMFYQYSIHGSELDPTAGADSRARVRTYSSLPGSSAAEAASLSRSKSTSGTDEEAAVAEAPEGAVAVAAVARSRSW